LNKLEYLRLPICRDHLEFIDRGKELELEVSDIYPEYPADSMLLLHLSAEILGRLLPSLRTVVFGEFVDGKLFDGINVPTVEIIRDENGMDIVGSNIWLGQKLLKSRRVYDETDKAEKERLLH